ncbi:primosomal protein N' [Nocardiopsis sp. HNM0947]|uniref:Probable replication restart protein PriA n=1 Tax=Nocardiopsis coralli TaxID=2772213 RepID=A0ABR9P0Q5_9ACTN|nr:primosomal protein N' [Nocardiopsis coralli]MBE2997397.1 primosomal protein N' [Nocardiopsis coralli]
MTAHPDPPAEALFDLPEPASTPAAQAKARTGKRPKAKRPAEHLPVARVVVDTPLPHLDRTFDYRVPENLDEKAVPGCRVRVHFNHRKLDGFLLERVERSEFTGRLAYLDSVVSPEPVLTPQVLDLARAVADRYAGTLNDVLRLAIPPRHGRVEKETAAEVEAPRPEAGAEHPASSGPQGDLADTGAGAAQAMGDAGSEGPGTSRAGAGAAHPAEAECPAGSDREEDLADTGASPTRPEAGAEGPAEHGTDRSMAVTGAATQHPDEQNPQVGGGAPGAPGAPFEVGPWAGYPEGPSFLQALREGRPARAVWNALPGPDWARAIAVAARAAEAAGRGTVVVVPDARDVASVDTALSEELGGDRHVALTAELGPAERYRRWLMVLRGQVRVVVGTRGAVFAPVSDLGLVVLWDDGDDVHADQHAPYPHARTVLSMRAHREGAGALIGGFTRTTDAQMLVEAGWAHPLTADRTTLRRHAPVIKAAGDDRELARDEAARSARMPSLALRTAREAARTGPVLFQVPRRGYLNTLACASCREPARCDHCRGPLAVRGSHAMPSCGWCGRVSGGWSCPECSGTRMRAVVVGARRTAEELGRAFPSLSVRTSGREEVLTRVRDRPSIVVATPGAEPEAENGYAAAVLLDGWALLNRMDLRASEEALRRWFNASALVRPEGHVVVSADAGMPVVQSLVRWDPGGYAERELAERRELGFPPAVSMASVTGGPEHVRELLDQVELPEEADLLGPVPVDTPGPDGSGDSQTRERALLRVPRNRIGALTHALKVAAAARSARGDEHLAQVRVDPLHVV